MSNRFNYYTVRVVVNLTESNCEVLQSNTSYCKLLQVIAATTSYFKLLQVISSSISCFKLLRVIAATTNYFSYYKLLRASTCYFKLLRGVVMRLWKPCWLVLRLRLGPRPWKVGTQWPCTSPGIARNLDSAESDRRQSCQWWWRRLQSHICRTKNNMFT